MAKEDRPSGEKTQIQGMR